MMKAIAEEIRQGSMSSWKKKYIKLFGHKCVHVFYECVKVSIVSVTSTLLIIASWSITYLLHQPFF